MKAWSVKEEEIKEKRGVDASNTSERKLSQVRD